MPEVAAGRRPRRPARGRRWPRPASALDDGDVPRRLEQGRLQGARPLGRHRRRPGGRRRRADPCGSSPSAVPGERVTRVVESVAGPVMAAAGVDASNTGGTRRLLLLPDDPDVEAPHCGRRSCRLLGLASGSAVVLSDTAGRPWRVGQTDFALGSAGLHVLDDLRGATDADGRPLAVTLRARRRRAGRRRRPRQGQGGRHARGAGARSWTRVVLRPDGAGAAPLVRTGPGDWFALRPRRGGAGRLGVAPGSPAADECGIAAVQPRAAGRPDRPGRPRGAARPARRRRRRRTATTCASAPTTPSTWAGRSPAWRSPCGARGSAELDSPPGRTRGRARDQRALSRRPCPAATQHRVLPQTQVATCLCGSSIC